VLKHHAEDARAVPAALLGEIRSRAGTSCSAHTRSRCVSRAASKEDAKESLFMVKDSYAFPITAVPFCGTLLRAAHCTHPTPHVLSADHNVRACRSGPSGPGSS
jgi:hypothetical protein